MRRILKNIALGVMLLAFLVSATGFRLVKHTCPSCNIVEYTLSEPDPCCDAHNFLHEEPLEPVSCCAITNDHISCSAAFVTATCCLIESNYYTIDEVVFAPSEKLEVTIVHPFVFSFGALVNTTTSASEEMLFAFKHPPPSNLSGVSFLVFLQQLKIPSC